MRRSYAGLVLVMFTAYADESGQEDAGIFVVAGYVFDPRKGAKFEKSWSKILERWKVSELHMKELTRFGGEYKGWSDNNRSAFLSSLTEIIHSRAEFHVAVSFDTFALRDMNPNDKQEILDAKKYSIAGTKFFADIGRQIGPDDVSSQTGAGGGDDVAQQGARAS